MPTYIEITIRAFGTQHNVVVNDSVDVTDVARPAQTHVVAISDSVQTDDVVGNVQDILTNIEFILDSGFTNKDSDGYISSYFAAPQTVSQSGPTSRALFENRNANINNQPSGYVDSAFYNVNDMSSMTEGEVFWVSYTDHLDRIGIDVGLWNLGSGGQCEFPNESEQFKVSFGSTTRRTITGLIASDAEFPAIWNIRSKSGQWVMTKNGVTVHQDFVNTVSFPAIPYVFRSSTGLQFVGHNGFLVVCREVQTYARRKAMFDYLSKRFNIAVTQLAAGVVYSVDIADEVAVNDSTSKSFEKHVTITDTAISTSDIAWPVKTPIVPDNYQELLGANLVALWHSQSGVTVFGTAVSDWEDNYNGNHMTVDLGTPDYDVDGSHFGGKQVVIFANGDTLKHESSLFSANSRPYVFCGGRFKSLADSYPYMWQLNGSDDMVLFTGGGVSVYTTQFKVPSIVYANSTQTLDTNEHFFESWLDGTYARQAVDGVVTATANSGSVSAAITAITTGNSAGGRAMYMLGVCTSVPTADQLLTLREMASIEMA